MVQVIVIQNGASAEQMANAVNAIPTELRGSVTTIGNDTVTGTTHISAQKFSTPSCLEMAIEKASSKHILLIDANITPTSSTLKSMTEQMSSENLAFLFAPIEHGQDIINISETSVEAMLALVSSEAHLPLTCCSFKKSLVKGNLDGDTSLDIMASLLMLAVTQAEYVTSANMSVGNGQSIDMGRLNLSRTARARCLRLLVNSTNIEELFPHHAWGAHREESAAASYHTLAALFIRYGDTNSALECLGVGDRFEDSPRSLALKGLIAIERGETLTAVANMVSSLQQYEARKKANNSHYVHFAPRDLDAISSNLNAGLEALHRKNNEEAVNHFAKAVFTFDPFYTQLGVAQIRNAAH
jgi:hypothetical protein